MTPHFHPVADRAVLVEFATALDPAAHRTVLGLDAALAAQPFPGFVESVPAFVTLLVAFDPLISDHDAVEQHLTMLLSAITETDFTPRTHDIPVIYDGADLDQVADLTGLTPQQVAVQHQAGRYQVAMYGFAPAMPISRACRRRCIWIASLPPSAMCPQAPSSSPAACA